MTLLHSSDPIAWCWTAEIAAKFTAQSVRRRSAKPAPTTCLQGRLVAGGRVADAGLSRQPKAAKRGATMIPP